MDCLGYKTCGGVLQHRECVIDKGNINLEVSTGFLQGGREASRPPLGIDGNAVKFNNNSLKLIKN